MTARNQSSRNSNLAPSAAGDTTTKTYVDTALDGKVDENSTITGATKTKVTYDAKGLVTAGTDAAVADISGLQAALDLKAPLASPTFTGTVAGITKAMVGLGSVDNTSNATERAAAATLTNKDLTSGTNTFPTLNQNTTGSAAKWTTPRNLAGNSVDGSAAVNFANKFIVQGTTDSGLSAAQFLGALGTGLVKNTTTTGVLSIGAAGTDYYAPGSTDVAITDGGTGVSTLPSGLLKGAGTGAITAAAAGTDYVAPGGALGTPSSGTLTNVTGLPISGLTASTSTAVGVGSVELGHATDTTLSRSAAGKLAVEGVDVVLLSGAQTLTGKTLTSPVINTPTGIVKGDVGLGNVTNNAQYFPTGTDVALADGGTGASLTDPNADRLMFWDDSAGAITWLTPGTNLSITGTTLDATGGGGGVETRPISASYRPLRGTTAEITPTVVTGFDATGMDVYLWTDADGAFRFVGCDPVAYTIDSTYAINNNNTLANSDSVYQSITIEFWSNASEIRTFTYTATDKSDVWAIVDDQYILESTYTHLPNVTNLVYYKLTQTPVWRKYRMSVGQLLSALCVNTGAQVVPTSPGFQLAVVGDSWISGGLSINDAVSAGTAGVINSGAIMGEFEQLTGVDVWRCAVGGTGYSNQGSFGANGPYGSSQRIAGLAALPPMHAVVAFGTANDGATAPATVVAAANTAWTAMKGAQPDALLIVIGVEPLHNTDTAIDAVNTALIAAAQAHADVDAVIDIRSVNKVLTGTGYNGALAGDGNSDVFVSTDTLHLTHHGNRYVAQELARLIGNVPIPVDRLVGSY